MPTLLPHGIGHSRNGSKTKRTQSMNSKRVRIRKKKQQGKRKTQNENSRIRKATAVRRIKTTLEVIQRIPQATQNKKTMGPDLTPQRSSPRMKNHPVTKTMKPPIQNNPDNGEDHTEVSERDESKTRENFYLLLKRLPTKQVGANPYRTGSRDSRRRRPYPKWTDLPRSRNIRTSVLGRIVLGRIVSCPTQTLLGRQHQPERNRQL